MGIQEVQNQNNAAAYQRKAKSGRAEGFQESLMQNLRYRNQGKEDITEAESGTRRMEESSGVGRINAGPGIRVSLAAFSDAMQAAEVRHMSYEESDNVRIAVTEGYTLKGKIQGKDAQVYVEAKYDDGRLEAFQVDTAKISGQTEHVIERFALETMEEGEQTYDIKQSL